MNRSKLLQGFIVIAVIVCAAYIAFISIPYPVNKHYEGGIYESNQLVKKVPVTVSGAVYRGLFNPNEFIGTVQIGTKTYSVETGRVRHLSPVNRIRTRIRSLHLKFPYLGVVGGLNSEGYVITVATIQMSRDFNAVYATTTTLSKDYGRNAELRAPVGTS